MIGVHVIQAMVQSENDTKINSVDTLRHLHRVSWSVGALLCGVLGWRF